MFSKIPHTLFAHICYGALYLELTYFKNESIVLLIICYLLAVCYLPNYCVFERIFLQFSVNATILLIALKSECGKMNDFTLTLY